MSFLWPGLLLLLLLVPALVAVYVLSLRRRRPSGVRYSSLSLVREALPRSSFLRRHLPFALFALAVAGLAVALARPVVIAAVPTNQTTIMLTIDVSGSMCSTDIPPSRLQAAEAAAIKFIESQGSGTQIGIVAFAGFAEIVQMPTNDHQVLHRRVAQPGDRAPNRGRQRDPGRHRRDRRDRPERRQELDRRLRPACRRSRCPRAPTPRRSSSSSPTAPVMPASRRPTPPSRRPTAGSGSTRSVSAPPTAAARTRAVPRSSSAASRPGRRWRRVRRRRWRRLPAWDRRGHAQAGRVRQRRRVLPGGERRAAPGGLRRPADEPDHEARGVRDRRRVRRVRGVRRGPVAPAREGLAPAALIAEAGARCA